jgi:hypothetical protein
MWHQRPAQWEQVFTPLIRGKSLFVIGLDGMGRAAWSHARHESSEVLALEPLPSSSEFWSRPNLMIDNMWVRMSLPLTTKTMRLLFVNLQKHLTGRPLQHAVDRMNEY